MAQIKLKDISSIMIFAGENANNNALALENRNYGYEDEIIGVLTKTSSNDSAFNKVPKEIFVETTPKYNDLSDLTNNAFAYIINKSTDKPVNEIYLNNDNIINFRYNYEQDLSLDINNAKIIPQSDIHLYLASINNSLYNKQKYYNKFNELDYITYNGIKYYWQKPGTILNESYINVTHEIGNDYVAYEMNSYSVQKTIWDESLLSYVPQFNEVLNEETGEVTKEPIMETQYSLKYKYSIKDIIKDKLHENVERYKNIYESKNLNSYYLYNLNNKMSFVGVTYSFGKNTFNILTNYDGEFNNWFNNRISFNVKSLESTENVKLADVILGEDYWTNLTINENEYICGESQKYNKDTNIELIANKLENDSINDIRLLSPYKVKKLDLSSISQNLFGNIDLLNEYDKKIDYINTIKTNWNKEKSNLLEELIIGKESIICNITNILGIEQMNNLKVLDIQGCNKLVNLDISKLDKLEYFNANNTNISVFQPASETVFTNVNLPESIESIILNNVSFNENGFNYTINDKLMTLELSNVTGIDTYEFIKKWIDILKENGKLNHGTINYINLNGIEWNNVSVNKLIELKQIELNEFTGLVNIIGEPIIVDGNEIVNEYISRIDYRLLYNLYSSSVFNENNDLKFNIKLDENAFKIGIKFEKVVKQIIEEVETVTFEEFGNVTGDIIDSTSGNSLLNEIQLNPNLFKQLTFNNFINNNRKNIGIYNQLSTSLDPNLNSEELENITIGDILLYKNQLVFASKDIKNINTHFIKLGHIDNIEELSKIFVNISEIINNNEEYKITLVAKEIDHTIIDNTTEDENSEVE